MTAKELLAELKNKLGPDEKIECAVYGDCTGLLKQTGIVGITNRHIIFYDGSIISKEFYEFYNVRRSLFKGKIFLDIFDGSLVIQKITAGPITRFVNLLWTKIPKDINIPGRNQAIEAAAKKLEEKRTKGLIDDLSYTNERKRITEAATHPQKMGPKGIGALKIGGIVFAVAMICLFAVLYIQSNVYWSDKDAFAKIFSEYSSYITAYDTQTPGITKIDYNYYPVGVQDVDTEISQQMVRRIKKLYDARENVDNVMFNIYLPYTDDYGKQAWQLYISFRVDRDLLYNKINWDNALDVDLLNIAYDVEKY